MGSPSYGNGPETRALSGSRRWTGPGSFGSGRVESYRLASRRKEGSEGWACMSSAATWRPKFFIVETPTLSRALSTGVERGGEAPYPVWRVWLCLQSLKPSCTPPVCFKVRLSTLLFPTRLVGGWHVECGVESGPRMSRVLESSISRPVSAIIQRIHVSMRLRATSQS